MFTRHTFYYIYILLGMCIYVFCVLYLYNYMLHLYYIHNKRMNIERHIFDVEPKVFAEFLQCKYATMINIHYI